jgi:hypothetical protein
MTEIHQKTKLGKTPRALYRRTRQNQNPWVHPLGVNIRVLSDTANVSFSTLGV